MKFVLCTCILFVFWYQVRVADPTFLGYFIDKGVSAAAKVVRKVNNFVFIFYF